MQKLVSIFHMDLEGHVINIAILESFASNGTLEIGLNT